MRTLTKAIQQNLTPEQALDLLKEGNKRFVGNIKANRDLLEQVNETSAGQYPFATILSCIDSRTSAELIFDQGLGDIFSIRIAGNVLNDDIIGSMEFGCKLAGSKLLLVLGHTRCGAVTGACNQVQLGKLTALLGKIKPAIDQETETKTERNGKNQTFLKHVTENNIHLVVREIHEKSQILAEMERKGEIKIVGGLYDVDNGGVIFYE